MIVKSENYCFIKLISEKMNLVQLLTIIQFET